MQKAGSTLRSSRAVRHPSTNRALRRLTSEVGRDPLHSTRYGRQRLCWELAPGYLHVLRGAREGARQTNRPLTVRWGCDCTCADRTWSASSTATSCAAHGVAAIDRERGALRLSLPVAKRVILRRVANAAVLEAKSWQHPDVFPDGPTPVLTGPCAA